MLPYIKKEPTSYLAWCFTPCINNDVSPALILLFSPGWTENIYFNFLFVVIAFQQIYMKSSLHASWSIHPAEKYICFHVYMCMCVCIGWWEGNVNNSFQLKQHICVPTLSRFKTGYFYTLSHFLLPIGLWLWNLMVKWVKKMKIIKKKSVYQRFNLYSKIHWNSKLYKVKF